MLLRILKWLHIIRAEILWTLVGTISGVWLTLHLAPGLEHSILLDFGMVLVVATLVFIYDKITHRHEGVFSYRIDHERLEKACHLDAPAASYVPPRNYEILGAPDTSGASAMPKPKPPRVGKAPQRPGEARYRVRRKFTGRE